MGCKTTKINTITQRQCTVCDHSDGYLFKWDAPGQQLNEISSSYDGIRVKGFLSGGNCNAAFYQVQRSFYVLKKTEPTSHMTKRKWVPKYPTYTAQLFDVFLPGSGHFTFSIGMRSWLKYKRTIKKL